MNKVKNITKFIFMSILAIVLLILPTNVNATDEIIIQSIIPEYDNESIAIYPVVTFPKNYLRNLA